MHLLVVEVAVAIHVEHVVEQHQVLRLHALHRLHQAHDLRIGLPLVRCSSHHLGQNGGLCGAFDTIQSAILAPERVPHTTVRTQ